MVNKGLLGGIIGFLLGGLVVSTAVTLGGDGTPSAGTHGQSSHSSPSELGSLYGDEFDAAFLASMIEHHEGAVKMAELAEDRAKHDEIKQLSRRMQTDQGSEIAHMKALQNMWDYRK